MDRPRPRLLPPPFLAGERASYDIRYGWLKAGTITLEVQVPRSELELEEKEWRFTGRALSSKIISPFYRVDDAYECRVDRRSSLPSSLIISVNESKEVGFRHVTYDHEAGVAHYGKLRSFYKNRGPSEETREDSLAPKAQDVFSALYFLRRAKLVPGDVFYIPVYDNGKNWDTRVEVFAPEKVSTGLGKMMAYKLFLQAELEGKLSAEKGYKIWLSADEKRLMVRWEAGLRFGSLKGILQRYRRDGTASHEGRKPASGEGWVETGVAAELYAARPAVSDP